MKDVFLDGVILRHWIDQAHRAARLRFFSAPFGGATEFAVNVSLHGLVVRWTNKFGSVRAGLPHRFVIRCSSTLAERAFLPEFSE